MPSLSFDIDGNNKKLLAALNEAQQQIQRTIQIVESTGEKMDETLVNAGKSVEDAMDKAGKSAEEMEEKIDKIDGSGMENLGKEAEEAADAIDEAADAAEDLGDKSEEASEKSKKAASGIEDAFGKVGKAIAGYFALDTIKEFIVKVKDVRKEFESLQVSFSTLLGSDVAGNKMFNEITDFATQTPLLEKDLASAAQTMLGFGISAEKVMPLLKQIGDISMGDSQKLQSLVLSFSQAASSGKLMGQDLMQMINAGFNPLNEMSRTTGKSMAELKDEMSKGQITVQMMEDAFKSATEEGGKFHNMLATQSQTLGGALSNLEGAVQKLFNDVGEEIENPMVDGVNNLTAIVNTMAGNLSIVASIITGLTAAFGTYKVACMAATAATEAHTLAEKANVIWSKLMKAATEAANKAMLTNPYVMVTAAIAGLIAAFVAWRATTKDVVQQQTALQKVEEETSEKCVEENARISTLKDAVHDYSLTLDERRRKLAELQKIVPEYHAALTKEGELINDNTQALDNYLAAFEKKVKLAAMEDELTQLYKRKVAVERQIKADEKKAEENEKNNNYADQAAVSGVDAKKLNIAANMAKGLRGQLHSINGEISDLKKEMQDADLFGGDNGNDGSNTTSTKTGSGKTAAQLASERLQAQTDEEKLLQDQQKARLREEADYRAKLVKMQIDAMEEGSHKRLEQLKYEAKAEDVELNREEEDKIAAEIDRQKAYFDKTEGDKASQNSTYAKRVFTADDVDMDKVNAISDRYDKLREENQAKHEKDLLKWGDDEAAAMNDWLKQYGNNQQKRAAIAEEWDAKIAKAEPYQVEGMTKQKNKDLIEFDDKTLQDSEEKLRRKITTDLMSQPIALNAKLDMSTMSTEDLKGLRSQLITGIDSLKDLPTDKLGDLQSMLDGINDTLTNRNPFAAFKEAGNELDSASREVEQYAKLITSARQELTDARESGDKMRIAQAERSLTQATNLYTNAIKKQSNADKKAKKAKGELGNTLAQIGGLMQDAGDIAGQFSDSAGDFVKGMGTLVSSVGQAVKISSEETSTAIKTIESASAILAIISAAIQLATAAANLFGGDGGKADYDEAKSKYDDLVEAWDSLIEKKKEYLSESWGTEIAQTEEEIQKLYQSEEAAAQLIAQKRLDVKDGHSYGYKMWNGNKYDEYSGTNGRSWSSVASEIDAAYGTNMQGERLYALTTLTSEQLQSIKENYTDLWAVMDDDFKSALEDIIKYGDAASDALEDAQNQLTQTSFDDMYDNFTETLMDMSADADTFGDNLAETMMKSLLSNQVGTEMKAAIQKWYNDYAEALKKGGGTMSQTDIEAFQKRYNEIVNEGLAKRDQIAAVTGYDEASSSEASGSINAAKSMSEDTANELIGRVTAVQLAVEQSRVTNQTTAAQILTGVTLLSTMATAAGASQALLDSILLQHVESNGYLNDIARYNKQMYEEWSGRISNIETKISTL